jgi:hypothetical protein
MQSTYSIYQQLHEEDVITVPYPYPIAEDNAESLMKNFINDNDKCYDMEMTPAILRLHNPTTQQKTNRAFLISWRDQEGELCGRKKLIHRLNEDDMLETVGLQTKKARRSYEYTFFSTPQPFMKPSNEVTPQEPRKVERTKIIKSDNLLHPGKMPAESQVRATFAPSNNYKRNLIKAHLLANATAIKRTPASKVHIERHGFDDSYTDQVLRCIVSHPNDSFTIHYFRCILGKHKHFDVLLDDNMTLKNWAPKKHLPMLKAFLGIE